MFRAYYTDVNAKLQAQAIALGGEINYLTPGEGEKAHKADSGVIDRIWNLWRLKVLPTLAINGASERNTSYWVAILRRSFFLPAKASRSGRSMTLSAFARFAFSASSPDATKHILFGLAET